MSSNEKRTDEELEKKIEEAMTLTGGPLALQLGELLWRGAVGLLTLVVIAGGIVLWLLAASIPHGGRYFLFAAGVGIWMAGWQLVLGLSPRKLRKPGEPNTELWLYRPAVQMLPQPDGEWVGLEDTEWYIRLQRGFGRVRFKGDVTLRDFLEAWGVPEAYRGHFGARCLPYPLRVAVDRVELVANWYHEQRRVLEAMVDARDVQALEEWAQSDNWLKVAQDSACCPCRDGEPCEDCLEYVEEVRAAFQELIDLVKEWPTDDKEA